MITSVREWIDRLEAEHRERKAAGPEAEPSEARTRANRRRRPHREERIRPEPGRATDALYEYEEVFLAPEDSPTDLVAIRPQRRGGVEVRKTVDPPPLQSEEAAAVERALPPVAPAEAVTETGIPSNIFTEIAAPTPPPAPAVDLSRDEELEPEALPVEDPALIRKIASEAGISDLVADHINGKWQDKTPAETLVTALEGLAAAAAEGGSPEEAVRLYEDAINIATRGRLAGSTQARLQGRLGAVHVQSEDYPGATECFEAAIRLYFEAGHHQFRPELIQLYNGLGLILKAHRRFEEGETCYHQAIQLQEQHDRAGVTELAVLHNNLGCLYYAAGHYSMAANVHRRSLEFRKEAGGTDLAALAEGHRNLALSALAAGDWTMSHKHLHEALNAYYQMSEGGAGREIIELLLSLATLHDDQGSYGDAEMMLIEAINQHDALSSRPDSLTAMMFNNLGAVYAKSGYLREACRMLERSLEIRGALITTHRTELAIVFANLGIVSQELGRRQQAEIYLQRAIDLFEQAEKAATADRDHVTSLYHDLLRPEANRVNAPLAVKLMTRPIEETSREQVTFLI